MQARITAAPAREHQRISSTASDVKPYEDVVRPPFTFEWRWKDLHPRANKNVCMKSLARDMFERGRSYEDFEKECERLRNLQEHDQWAAKNEDAQPNTLREIEKWLGIVSPSETS